jgi:hypothetical protein
MTTNDVLTPDRADLLGQLDDAMWSSPLDGGTDRSADLDAMWQLGLVERYQRPVLDQAPAAFLYRQKTANVMLYTFDAISLYLRGRISWPTLKLALRTRQPAVSGRFGSEIICRQTARDIAGMI